jgi:hypothetical protein
MLACSQTYKSSISFQCQINRKKFLLFSDKKDKVIKMLPFEFYPMKWYDYRKLFIPLSWAAPCPRGWL